jgi:hypothetical protein
MFFKSFQDYSDTLLSLRAVLVRVLKKNRTNCVCVRERERERERERDYKRWFIGLAHWRLDRPTMAVCMLESQRTL